MQIFAPSKGRGRGFRVRLPPVDRLSKTGPRVRSPYWAHLHLRAETERTFTGILRKQLRLVSLQERKFSVV